MRPSLTKILTSYQHHEFFICLRLTTTQEPARCFKIITSFFSSMQDGFSTLKTIEENNRGCGQITKNDEGRWRNENHCRAMIFRTPTNRDEFVRIKNWLWSEIVTIQSSFSLLYRECTGIFSHFRRAI